MNAIVGQVTLGVYALLLAVGGIMGYVKAGSKPSLIAGVGSAVVALACQVIINMNRTLGLALGAVLAAILLAVFGKRFSKSRKFMPGGILMAVSLVVLLILAANAALGPG
jgi:uncharacterized membrane protein (UPF0136 family)